MIFFIHICFHGVIILLWSSQALEASILLLIVYLLRLFFDLENNFVLQKIQ